MLSYLQRAGKKKNSCQPRFPHTQEIPLTTALKQILMNEL